ELDWESIVVGLLHDTIEDTNLVTFEKIKEQFGATVRHIVEGETKVSKLGKLKYKNESNSVQDVKAHDLRQMFLAMTEEMATVNGAKVILWDNEIGSLKVGKKVGWGKDELVPSIQSFSGRAHHPDVPSIPRLPSWAT
ncbi:putative GTP diphosphokinase RSH1, chloroplastic, partial [Tanacetum coccineum]